LVKVKGLRRRAGGRVLHRRWRALIRVGTQVNIADMKAPFRSHTIRFCPLLLALPLLVSGATPQLPGIGAAMQSAVDARTLSGAVTVVVTRDRVLHCEATGLADLAKNEPMRPDSVFWIASMTKPVTGVAVLMLQDEGKLNVAYILMLQRADIGNSDGSEFRRAFQQAAVDALLK
jgi:CubicO group peptidase (beta-lactamase class C family)